MSAGIVERLEGRRICIVAGAGGVGKTTASAALALGMAASGRRVAVVTIDPARRLADALGLERLDNEPHLVDPAGLARHGIEMRGELWAMMLDPKATFDELIARLAPDERAREEILRNRIYAQLSGAIAGSQEFGAVARLYELHSEGGYDAIVLDTPPSRNALDFLDAPDRLTDFFAGRAVRMFAAPAGLAARMTAAGTALVFAALKRLTGVDLLDDAALLFAAMGGLLDGLRERAAAVKALLADEQTAFVLVASPEREPVAEAIYFHARLREARMAYGGLVVNRATLLGGGGEDPATVREQLRGALGERLAAKVAEGVEEQRALAARDAAAVARLSEALDEPAPVVVPRLDDDVQDVDGLLALYRHLAGDGG